LITRGHFVTKVGALTQPEVDKLRSLQLTDQERITGLALDQLKGELAKVPTPPAQPPHVNYLLGNPSNAVTDPNSPNNYLLERGEYALSYNRDKGTPNWVSWHVDSSDLGAIPRNNIFHPDTALPAVSIRYSRPITPAAAMIEAI